MKKRTIVIHGAAHSLSGLVSAVKDSEKWHVTRNGRKVKEFGSSGAAVDYVADETGMHRQTVQMEAMGGSKLIDDAQVAWQITKASSKDEKSADSDKFTPAMIEELRRQYSQIRAIDPSSETYEKLVGFLNRLPQSHLKQLSEANIPFLSRLARNRVRDAKYHTCPECEANFPASSLVSGKLPAHKFLGKPCPGAGTMAQDARDAGRYFVTINEKNMGGPSVSLTRTWRWDVHKWDNNVEQWKPVPGAFGLAKSWELAKQAGNAEIRKLGGTVNDHCSDPSMHVGGDPSMPLRDANWATGTKYTERGAWESAVKAKWGEWTPHYSGSRVVAQIGRNSAHSPGNGNVGEWDGSAKEGYVYPKAV